MNDEQIKEEKSAGSSRLGKEAKIGVTVILALVLILGIVATVRFTRSAANDSVASAEVQQDNKETTGQENTIEATEKHGRRKLHPGNNEAAIVVTAEPASTKPSETAARDSDLWKFGADKSEAKRTDGSRPAIGSPPPLMPDPPKLHHREHEDRNGEGVGPLRDAGNEVRLVSPESPDMGVGRSDPSGYAVAESAPAPPPSRREQTRYADVAAQPPEPLPVQPQYSTGAGYGATVNPGASYGGSDYRREAQQGQSRALTVSTGRQYRGGRTYTVAEGDTLFNIARYELGKASRWVEIYELNRPVLGKDFNSLTPGIQLTLPEREKSDTLTRQAGSTYQR